MPHSAKSTLNPKPGLSGRLTCPRITFGNVPPVISCSRAIFVPSHSFIRNDRTPAIAWIDAICAIGPYHMCGAISTPYTSPSAAIFLISLIPPQWITSGCMIIAPFASNNSRNCHRFNNPSPPASGTGLCAANCPSATFDSRHTGSSRNITLYSATARASSIADRIEYVSYISRHKSSSLPTALRIASISLTSRPSLSRSVAARGITHFTAVQPSATVRRANSPSASGLRCFRSFDQCDQYTRSGFALLPPNSRHTGTFSRLPSMSHNAISIADSAVISTLPSRQRFSS